MPTVVPRQVGLRADVEGVAAPFVPTASPSSPLPRKPPWLGFRHFTVIGVLLKALAAAGTVSMAQLRRDANAVISASLGHPAAAALPRAMDIHSMYQPQHVVAGADALPAGDHHINVLALDALHVSGCVLCQSCDPSQCVQHTTVCGSCYYASYRQTFINGVRPIVSNRPIIPQDGAPGPPASGTNHGSLLSYPSFVASQLASLLAQGVIEPAGELATISPLGVALQSSRVTQAYALTGRHVTSDKDVEEINSMLLSMGLPKLKQRLIFNLSWSGVNDAYDAVAFRYIRIGDIIALMTPGGFMGVTDIEAYFLNIPLAAESRFLCSFRYLGKTFQYKTLSFGGKPFPYLACVLTAELCQGIRRDDLPVEAMIDDFWTIGRDEAHGKINLSTVRSKLGSVGLVTSDKKTQFGQRVLVIGFLLDTTRMSVSFDPASAHGFALQLMHYITILLDHGDVSHHQWEHVCGKLSHYSEIVQAGRCHMWYCWAYLRHGPEFSLNGRVALLSELHWWLAQLRSWAAASLSGKEFPIVSGSMLLDDPAAITVLVSDMAGDDGIGFVHGHLDDPDPEVCSFCWPDERRPGSTHVGELLALLAFLRMMLARGLPLHPCLVPWVTDNAGAAYSVNSGVCHEAEGAVVLAEILDICDSLSWTPLALWVPRELNSYADFLSHLSSLLNCRWVTGRVSDVCGLDEATHGHPSHVEQAGVCPGFASVQPTRTVLRSAESSACDDILHSVGLRHGLGGQAERVDEVCDADRLSAEDSVGLPRDPMVIPPRRDVPANVYRPTSVRRHLRDASDERAPLPPPGKSDRIVGLDGHCAAAAGGDADAGAQCVAPLGRGVQQIAGVRRRVVSRHERLSPPAAPYQDWAFWRWCLRRGRSLPSPSQRVSTCAPHVEGSGFGPPTVGVSLPGHSSGISRPYTAGFGFVSSSPRQSCGRRRWPRFDHV